MHWGDRHGDDPSSSQQRPDQDDLPGYNEAAWLALLFQTFGAERAPTASDDGTIVWKQWEGWVAAG